MKVEGAKTAAELGASPTKGSLDKGKCLRGGERSLVTLMTKVASQNALPKRADPAFNFSSTSMVKGGVEPLVNAHVGTNFCDSG